MFARSYIKARRLRYCTCVKAFKLEKKPSSIQVSRSLRQFLRTDAAPNTVLGSPIFDPLARFPCFHLSLHLGSPPLADDQRRSARYVRASMLFTVLRKHPGSLPEATYLGPRRPEHINTGKLDPNPVPVPSVHCHPRHWHPRHQLLASRPRMTTNPRSSDPLGSALLFVADYWVCQTKPVSRILIIYLSSISAPGSYAVL